MAAPPAGSPAQLDDAGASYQTNIIVCAVITWVVAVVFVAARFYTRRVLLRVLRPEDWMIVVALIFAAANNAGMIEQAVYGLGRHIWTLPAGNIMPLSRAGWYSIIWYIFALWATKISILLLYLRILTYTWAGAATKILIGITMVTNIWTFASVLTACIPIQAFWDLTVAGVCHTQDWWWAITGMHMVTDFLIYVLPVPVIFTLRMPNFRQKMLLYFTFAFGFFVCLISIVRLVYLTRGAYEADFSYGNIPIALWTCIEVNAAIVCACIMTLRPLVNKLFPKLLGERPITTAPQRASHSIGGRRLVVENLSTRPKPAKSSPRLVVPGREHSDTPMLEKEENEPSAPGDLEAQTEQARLPPVPVGTQRDHNIAGEGHNVLRPCLPDT